MVPWLFAAFKPTILFDGLWAFAVRPGRIDPVCCMLTGLLWLCAISVVVVTVAQRLSFSLSFFVAVLGFCLACMDLTRRQFHHCDFPVRFTTLAACKQSQGQQALRLMALHQHPLCIVISLCAHDPGQSKKESRLIVWRHQYSAEQYRRMTLILRWLSAGEHHE